MKVALILDRDRSPAWIECVVEELISLPQVEVAAVTVTDACTKFSFSERFYKWVDGWLYPREFDALAMVSLSHKLKHIPTLDLTALRVEKFDAVINLSSVSLLEMQHNIWRFELNRVGEVVCLSLWETQAASQRLLCQGYSAYLRHSLGRTQSQILWRAAGWLRAVCAGYVAAKTLPIAREDLHPTPSSWWFLLITPLWDFLSRGLRRSQWFLLFKREERARDIASYISLLPPSDRFWADPHLLCKDGVQHVFFEQYFYPDNSCTIATLSLSASGAISQIREVLRRPYPLSFPFVFEFAGEVYMMPETSANRSVELYRATRFPDEWQLHRALIQNMCLVDSTLFFYEGRWWLFSGGASHAGACPHDELYLYYADSPCSETWTAHPQNPVVLDVRGARPAGVVFAQGGRLYRPGQVSAPLYGQSIKIFAIDCLTPEQYIEHEVEELAPLIRRGQTGLHTWSSNDSMSWLDARRWIWRRPKFLGAVKRPGPRILSP